MVKNELNFTPHQLRVIQSDNHVALTANAGSGKTFVLKYKYLNAAKKLNGDLSKIAAITFTNKAANELYKKISELVNEEINLTRDRSQLSVLYKIKRNLVSAYISTIHSFCIEILRNYPVEAGVDANFIPIDQSTADELIELSINEVVDSMFRDDINSVLIKELIRYFGTRYKLESELKKLLNNKKNVHLLKERIYCKTNDEIKNYFDNSFDSLINEIKNIYGNDLLNSVEEVNNLVLASDRENQIAIQIEQACDEFIKEQDILSFLIKLKELAFTKEGTIRKKGYLSKTPKDSSIETIKILENLYSRLKILADINLDSSIHNALAALGKKILFLFEQISMVYEFKKRKNSYIDFDDILIKTKLLLNIEHIQKELSSKFSYLMVDEYQDTDEIQYDIFLPILDDLRNGNLFIVGDDKQSIYRFRDADLKVFDKTRTDISNQNQESGLQLLPDSFRMAKELCLFTNYVFNKLFHSSIPLFNELENVPIVCAKDDNEIGEIEFLASDQVDDKSQSQAELTALKILELANNYNISYSNIAVLVTKRKHFDELEKSFTIKKIPYKIIGGRGFFQKQIISDLRNYLSFISNPDDDVALIAILRSPFFMLSDSEIFKISLSQGNSFYEKLKNYSSIQKKYFDIIIKLENQIKSVSSFSISKLIRQILSDSDFLLIIKNRHNGEQELANIEKLLSIAKDFDKGGFKTLYDFVKFLDDSLINKPDEAQAEGILSDSGVQLMTIHQAKGLEFQVVFLYRCESYPDSSHNKAREITVNKELGLLFKVPPIENPLDNFIIPPVLAISNFIEEARDLAEIKRLLYVGVTRAINKLFIVYEKDEEGKYNPKSFIKLLQDVLPEKSNNLISIEDEVKFLTKKDHQYLNFTKRLKIEIKVTSYIDPESIKFQIKEEPEKKYLISISKLDSPAEHQIISATKISIFEKCQLKYHLTYNIGLAKLLNLFPVELEKNLKLVQYLDYFRIQDEDDEVTINPNNLIFTKSSERFGQIIHKILEKNILLDKINLYLDRKLNIDEFRDENTKNSVIQLLQSYYNSEFFKELNEYKNFKNEIEIMIKEENVILKGVIDKIIFSDDSIIIIDYKTDVVDERTAEIQYKEYEIQMKFYLYISMKFFEKIDKFSAKLIFLRNPNLCFELNYKRGNLSELREEILSLVRGILENKSEKNLNHCPNCIYSLNNKNCIIK